MSEEQEKNNKIENNVGKIQKRDGTIVVFEQEKITEAIHKAVTAAKQGDGDVSKKVSDKVVS